MHRRVLGLIGAVALLFTPAISGAASNPFIGTWQTTTSAAGIQLTINLVLNPQGGYSELDQGYSPTAGKMVTRETGTYNVMAPNVLRLNVINWDPKVQCLPGSGAAGGCVPIRKPPGTTYRYRFTSANTFTAQDVTFGNNGPTLTYRKI
jgi:hypothetical protein